jgi:hypothetical protein
MADRYASLKQGLVGCWIPSVSGSGLLLPDVSGRGNHGVLTNMDASDWVSAQYGRALDFDGSNDYVQLSSISDSTGQITATAWARQTTAILSVYAVFSCTNSSATVIPFQLESFNNRWGFIWGESPYIRVQVSFTLIPNQWYHLALVRSGSTGSWNYRFFVDGIQWLSATTTTSTGASNPIAIARNGDRNAQFFPGNIDDVRLYNRALTEPEIRLLASRPGIGLVPERKSLLFQQQQFSPAWSRRQQLIGSGVY